MIRILLTSLLILLLCTCGRAQLICGDDDCGDIQVGYVGTNSEVVLCEGATIILTNTSEPGFSEFIVAWGDGVQDTIPNYGNINHTYNFEVPDDGSCNDRQFFRVEYLGQTSCAAGVSCQSAAIDFTVEPKPIAQMSVSNEVCAGRPVEFTNNSCNATNFMWDFGDGNTSTEENPTHTYADEGTYTVTLRVDGIDACAAFNNVTAQTVTIVNPPNSLFAVSDDDLIACRGEVVTFTNQSNDDTNIRWEISPGDANGSNWEYVDEEMNEFSDVIAIRFNNDREYTITLTGSNDCDEVESEQTITILEAPNLRPLEDQEGCDEVTISSSILGSNVTGDFTEICWSFPDGNATEICTETFGPITFTSSGRVVLTVTSLCGDRTEEAMITVQSSEAPTLTAEDRYCTGSTPDTLMASTPGGEWDGPGIIDEDLGIFDPSVAGPGMHTITYEITNGVCDNMNSITVLVEGSVAVTVQDEEACEDGTAFQLTASPGGGVWSGDGVTDPSGTFDPTTVVPGVIRPEYTFTDPSNGCSVVVSPRIEVNELPVVTSRDTAITCNENETVDLEVLADVSSNVGGGNFGSWTLNGMPLSGSTINPTTDLPGPGDYEVTFVYTNTPCTVPSGFVLSVVEKPVLNLTPQPVLCVNGDPVVLEASLPGGDWTGTGVNTAAGTFDPAAAGVGTFTLDYVVMTGTCINEGSLMVEVVEGAEVSVSAPDFCLDSDAAQLTATPPGGVWSGDGITDPSGTFDPDSAGVGPANPVYTFVDEDGCTITASPPVEVFALPNVLAMDTALACLVNDPVDLEDISGVNSDVDGGGYVWTLNGEELPGATFVPQGLGGAGVYPVEFVYTNGPCRVPGALELEVIDNPELMLAPQDDVCISAQTLTLGANLSGGEWTGTAIDSETGEINLEAAGGGTFTYRYEFQPGGSCAQVAEQQITIEDPAENITAGGGQQACEFSETTLTLSGASPSGGFWVGPGITDSLAGTVDLTQLEADSNYTFTYEFEVETVPGCRASASKVVAYDPAPDPNFTIDGSPCINESFQLNAAQSGGGFDYDWDFGDGSGSTQANPTHTYTAGGTFDLTLEVISPRGCPNDTATTVYVTTPPSPSFQLDSTLGCAAFTLNLIDESSGDDFTSFWQVAGDTLPGGGSQQVILDGFLEDTEVEVILTAENFCGARTQVQSVVVKPYPAVDFGLSVDDGCSLFTPEISNVTLGNPDRFFWDYGQGTTSFDSIPLENIEYFTPDDSVSTYTITLVAQNECGLDTLQREITVFPPDVDAFISLDTIAGCQPWTFEPRSFSTPGSELAWEVLAPDGSTFASGNEAAPSFELTQPGIHRVILRAARCGSDADTVFVDVLPAPEVSFTADPAVCQADVLQLTNTSQGIAGGVYDLGNGTTTDQLNTEVTFDSAGDYTVTFTGFSALNNCPASVSQPLRVHPLPSVTIAASDTSGCAPLTTTLVNIASPGADLDYAWDFGDGTATSDTPNPAHDYLNAGDYFPTLTVTDSVGCTSDTFFSRITVHPDPVAAFTITTDRFCVGYDSLRLEDASEGAVALVWTVDGTQFPGFAPTLPLTTAGPGTVSLAVTSANGCEATSEQVYNSLPSPVAAATATPDSACLGSTLSFASTSSNTTDLLWSLGDGAGSTEAFFDHRYGSAGDYLITLIATNSNGCPADTARLAATIHPLPEAAFTLSETVACGTPAPVNFANASTGGLSFAWSFGDGATATTLDAEHTYTTPGTYLPQLIATTTFGCRDTASQELIVSGDPIAAFDPPPARGCSPYLLQLTATPTEALRYEWYLDDAFSPQVGETFDTLLTQNRSHNLRLIAIYDDLCRDTLDVANLITLEPRPVADFIFEEDQEPNRLGDVFFQSTSTGGDELYWDLGDGTIRFDASFVHEYRQNRDLVVTHAVTQRYEQGLVCSDTLRQNVEPEWLTTFFVPNAITPESGPDENQTWGAKGFGVASYELRVFSAYGQIIFQTDALEDSSPVGRWDGRLGTSGELAQQGAYTWRAQIEYVDGNTETQVGTVTVVR